MTSSVELVAKSTGDETVECGIAYNQLLQQIRTAVAVGHEDVAGFFARATPRKCVVSRIVPAMDDEVVIVGMNHLPAQSP